MDASALCCPLLQLRPVLGIPGFTWAEKRLVCSTYFDVCVCVVLTFSATPLMVFIVLMMIPCSYCPEGNCFGACAEASQPFIFICAFIETNSSVCSAWLLRTQRIYSVESQEEHCSISSSSVFCIYGGNIFKKSRIKLAKCG